MSHLVQRRQNNEEDSGVDHRWFLFLIPIILIFFALIFTVWYVIHRRRKQRQRRSVLRNVTLVVAREEKERERLSRGNSVVSRLSRIGSSKSKSGRGSRSARTRPVRSDLGHDEPESSSSATHGTSSKEKPTEANTEEECGRHAGSLTDIEASAADVLPETYATHHILAREDLGHINRTNKNGLSVIGERRLSEGVEEEGDSASAPQDHSQDVLEKEKAPVQQGSQPVKEITRADSTLTTLPSSTSVKSNPFTTPTGTSSGHGDVLSSPIPETPITSPGTETHHGIGSSPKDITITPVTSASGGSSLGRKLSEVIRLRQPSPLAARRRQPSGLPNPTRTPSLSQASKDAPLARSSLDNRSASTAKGRQSIDVSSISSPRPDVTAGERSTKDSANEMAGPWTYTSRAHEWKTSPAPTSDALSSEPASSSPSKSSAPARRASMDESRSKPGHEAGSGSMISTAGTSSLGDNEAFRKSSRPPISRSASHLPIGATLSSQRNQPQNQSSTQLGRKPSIGVAGSRFKESFDD